MRLDGPSVVAGADTVTITTDCRPLEAFREDVAPILGYSRSVRGWAVMNVDIDLGPIDDSTRISVACPL
jgi:hypothetical protein